MSRKFLTAIDLAKNELQNATVGNLAAAPSSPVKGQLYFNSTDNTLYWYNGTAWVAATGAAGVTYGNVTAEPTFGSASNNGIATTVSRSDHAHGNPTHVAADHSAIPVSSLAAATGVLNMNGQQIQNLATPTNGTDAANRNYVDNNIAGLAWKDAVRAATTANITLSAPQTIDGVSVIAGDRVLVKNQTTASQNGIYLVASGAWTRTTDADLDTELVNAAVYVSEGTTLADTAWVMTTNLPITVNTTSLSFSQFAGAGLYAAGNGLTLTGQSFDVGAGTGISVAADSVALDTTYSDGRYYRKYATNVGGATSVVVNHALNSRDVLVDVYRVASPFDTVEADVERTDANNVTLRFTAAPAAGEYRCVVAG